MAKAQPPKNTPSSASEKPANQWQLGRLFGIPLRIDPSWVFILGLVTVANAVGWREEFPTWSVSLTWITGFLTAILLFASVLLHELGHSLVAKSQGIQVNSITLFLFGGIASLDQEAKTPGATFWVAIAGPLVSLALWAGLSAVALATPAGSALNVLSQSLGQINLILVVFNLIPGLPLDGGQVLKAGIWKLTGNRFQGSHWAARVGQALGWGAVILGLFVVLLLGSFSGVWMALLGWYGLRNAYRYDRYTDLQEIVLTVTARDVMTRSFRVVDGAQSLRDFADQYLLQAEAPQIYFAATQGRYQGRVDPDRLSQIERSQWEQQTVAAIVTPIHELTTVPESAPLTQVVPALEQESCDALTVLSPAGAIAGLIDRRDIVQTMMAKMELSLPSAELERISANQTYPAFLPMVKIVETIAVQVPEDPASMPQATGSEANLATK